MNDRDSDKHYLRIIRPSNPFKRTFSNKPGCKSVAPGRKNFGWTTWELQFFTSLIKSYKIQRTKIYASFELIFPYVHTSSLVIIRPGATDLQLHQFIKKWSVRAPAQKFAIEHLTVLYKINTSYMQSRIKDTMPF